MMMQWIRWFLLFGGLCSCRHVSDSQQKIVGGQVTRSLPFFAGIRLEGGESTFCGGSFIGPRLVVTAAHCVELNNQKIEVVHGLASQDDLPRKTAVKAQSVLIHPNYNPLLWDNDIALILLEPYKTNIWSGLTPIALNSENFQPETDRSIPLRVVGFGNASSFGDLYRTELMEADLQVLDGIDCRKSGDLYRSRITDRQICAENADRLTVDACYGDSGGPLFQTVANGSRLMGLVSWGDGCAMQGKPGSYTRISAYREWVETESRRLLQASAESDPASLKKLFEENCYYAGDDRSQDTGDANLVVNAWLKTSGPFLKGTSTSGTVLDTCQVRDGASHQGQARILKTPGGQYLASMNWLGQTYEAPLSATWDNYLSCHESIYENFFHIVRRPDLVSGTIIFRNRDYVIEGRQTSASTNVLYQCTVGTFRVDILSDVDSSLQLKVSSADFTGNASWVLTPFTIPFPELSIQSNDEKSREGWLQLKNSSEHPLLSWEISCPFAYTLISPDGQTWPSDARTGVNTVQFLQQKTPWGYVEGGKAIEFQLTLKSTSFALIKAQSCKVNGRNFSLVYSNR